MKATFWVLVAAGAAVAQTGWGGMALDRKAMQTSYEEGRREELKASLESLLGSTALAPSDRAECLRYLSALYGDDGAEGKAASGMLQLIRLDPQRASLGLKVKPRTDSLFQGVRGEYLLWRADPEGAGRLQPIAAPLAGSPHLRMLPWIAAAVAGVAAAAAVMALAWP